MKTPQSHEWVSLGITAYTCVHCGRIARVGDGFSPDREVCPGRTVVSAWIPADKELPGTLRNVLATDCEGVFVAFYNDGAWVCPVSFHDIDSVVTHWMEFPEVPE